MDERSLRQVLSALGIQVLRKSATGWLHARCPFAKWTHAKKTLDRRPGFGAFICDDGNSYYKCFTCQMNGRISSLVRGLEHYRNVSYGRMAVDADIADTEGLFAADFENISRMAQSYEEPIPIDDALVEGIYPNAMDVPEAARYLAKRGIGSATAEKIGLLYHDDERRIIFPVRGRNRQLYGFTSRSILEEQDYPRRDYPKVRDFMGLPKRQLLLGIEHFQRGKPMLVIEGLFGYAHLIEIGAQRVCNPVALMGSEMTQAKASYLSMLGENVYLLLDNDAGGEVGLWGHIDKRTNDYNNDGAVARLQSKMVPVLVPGWPDGKSDPDQLTYAEVEAIIENTPLYA